MLDLKRYFDVVVNQWKKSQQNAWPNSGKSGYLSIRGCHRSRSEASETS